MEGVPVGLSQRLTDVVLVSLRHCPSPTPTLYIFCCLCDQAKGPDGELVVNFDQTLHTLLCEARHLSHPPLSVRMPPAIKSLTKTTDLEELRDRRASLELVMQIYRDIQAGMSDEERLLLQGKLQQIHKVGHTECHTLV